MRCFFLVMDINLKLCKMFIYEVDNGWWLLCMNSYDIIQKILLSHFIVIVCFERYGMFQTKNNWNLQNWVVWNSTDDSNQLIQTICSINFSYLPYTKSSQPRQNLYGFFNPHWFWMLLYIEDINLVLLVHFF